MLDSLMVPKLTAVKFDLIAKCGNVELSVQQALHLHFMVALCKSTPILARHSDRKLLISADCLRASLRMFDCLRLFKVSIKL